MDIYEESLRMHEKKKGKISITSKVAIKNQHDLSIAYTPGVAEPCRMIHKMLMMYINIHQKEI